MPLLNYTTTVPVSRTIGQIHETLVNAGARSIMSTYADNGKPVGLQFALMGPVGVHTYTLPVDAAKVLLVLRKEKAPPRYQNPDQAERIAWRITKDWLEAQLAIVATEMVSFDQVMLPYMHAREGQTVYELFRDERSALPAGDRS